MTFQAVEDAGQAVVHGAWSDGIETANVFGFALTATLTQVLADSLTGLLATAFTELLGGTSDEFTYTGTTVTDLRTEGAPQFDSVAGAFPMAGTDTVNPLPYQTAALISWGTDRRGRSFRGRTYLGGFCEDFSNGRIVSSTLVTALNAFKDDLIGDAAAWGIISRFSGVVDGVPTPRDPAIITAVTNGTVHDHWRTQRGRALA